ncbi:peptidase family M49-domain-containing protein [Aspergillus karnatakaensis]|uniref:peptidase family M49-domain-containing protein n=1 Tax=Aspergillus karnatakaensis TaxID=1810916 RepID=UPI003CCDF821
MPQISAESTEIFDLILELHRACGGDWESLIARCGITKEELDSFLEYAAVFLCNLRNYYGEGDQKFVPELSAEALRRIAGITPSTKARLERIIEPLLSVPPFNLGYPGEKAQSAYYSGTEPISKDEIDRISDIMRKHSIGPENTRVCKQLRDGKPLYYLLQASAEVTDPTELEGDILLVNGDHASELSEICLALSHARQYANNEKQERTLNKYIEAFRTGSLDAFQESQKIWVTDIAARVENMIGFIEAYRDPAGIRSEWEAMVGIADPDETARLKRFVNSSTAIIQQLPWAVEGINNGKGPFEKSLFEAPDFTSVHALAVCGSIVFEAANLPNYEYIRETCGFRNIVLANRLSANNNPRLPCPWVDPSELTQFKRTTHIVRFLTTTIHELIGHGTGKLFSETSPGVYNFDKQSPPISPLTNGPVSSHYTPGQKWSSTFRELSGTVEERRAILVSEYPMDNKEILEIFGYIDESEITADEPLYTTYLNIGVDGLQALEHYNVETKTWGQVHHQAHYSILKHLLQSSSGVIRIDHDRDASRFTVRVDSTRCHSDGKPVLGDYLCRLHIWRCTADVSACKEWYEPLCQVEDVYEEWRQIVCPKPKPRWRFVQPNPVVTGGEEVVSVKVYEETNEGIIQPWVERGV